VAPQVNILGWVVQEGLKELLEEAAHLFAVLQFA